MRRAEVLLGAEKLHSSSSLPVEFFIQKRVSIRQNTRLCITESAFEPLSCFEKEHPRAITDSDGKEKKGCAKRAYALLHKKPKIITTRTNCRCYI
ncbi:unnamed protein product [Bathycoccus prasinos]